MDGFTQGAISAAELDRIKKRAKERRALYKRDSSAAKKVAEKYSVKPASGDGRANGNKMNGNGHSK